MGPQQVKVLWELPCGCKRKRISSPYIAPDLWSIHEREEYCPVGERLRAIWLDNGDRKRLDGHLAHVAEYKEGR